MQERRCDFSSHNDRMERREGGPKRSGQVVHITVIQLVSAHLLVES